MPALYTVHVFYFFINGWDPHEHYTMVLAIKTDLALRYRLLLCLVEEAPPSIVVLSITLAVPHKTRLWSNIFFPSTIRALPPSRVACSFDSQPIALPGEEDPSETPCLSSGPSDQP